MQPNQTGVHQKETVVPLARGRGEEIRFSCLRRKSSKVAITLVAVLSLVASGAPSGPASANQENSRGHNPNLVETVFDCDRNGDGIYETPYELVSTFNSVMWQDKNSTAVLIQRLRVDVIDSYYTALPPENPDDPVGTDFADPDVYWFDGPQDYSQGGGKPKGWKTVRCTEVVSYPYTATADDAALGIGFVEGARYTETDTNLYDVTIRPNGQGQAKAANADHKSQAERQHKAKKNGKHRHKGGKHRR
jgi:hypothetical protein